jgi:DNA-binding transcriptional regulator PaaX
MVFYTKTSKGAYQLLADLAELSQEISSFIVNLADLKRKKSLLQRKQTSKTISYLKSAGYLYHIGDTRYELTDLGKINVLRELVKRRKPDGKSRIIIFDIPENLKRNRDYFRRHIVNLGFRMEQRSVWCSKVPCDDLVKLVIEHHNLNKYASLIVGDIIHY